MANEGTPRKMTTSRSHGTFLMTAVVSALIAQRAHGFLVSVPTPSHLCSPISSSLPPQLIAAHTFSCRQLLQFHKTTPEREAEVLGLRNSKTILALAEGVSVAMMLEEEDIVRFRTVSSIQTGTTEGLPEALAIVDALQLILPEPGIVRDPSPRVRYNTHTDTTNDAARQWSTT